MQTAAEQTDETKTQHTPGPWVVRRGHRGSTDVFNAHNAFVCTVGTFGDTVEADGRLIAAAPELLAALKALAHVATWDDDTDRAEFDAAFALAEAAIVKAEGR